MPILQTMLPVYMDALKSYIEMNKRRSSGIGNRILTTLTWSFLSNEYKLCAAKRDSAEKLLLKVQNLIDQFDFDQILAAQQPPKRSVSATIIVNAPPTPIPRSASTEACDNPTILNAFMTAVTPLAILFPKLSNIQVVPSPQLLPESSPKQATVISSASVPSRSNNSRQFLKQFETTSVVSMSSRSNNSAVAQPPTLNITLDNVANDQMSGFEYADTVGSENNPEDKLYTDIKLTIIDEIAHVAKKRAEFSTIFGNHQESSYDFLLQIILLNLEEVVKLDQRMCKIIHLTGPGTFVDPFFQERYRGSLIFIIHRFLCLFKFDQAVATHQKLSVAAKQAFCLNTGYDAANIDLCKQVKDEMKQVSVRIFSPHFEQTQYVKTMADLTVVLRSLQKLPGIKKDYTAILQRKIQCLTAEFYSRYNDAPDIEIMVEKFLVQKEVAMPGQNFLDDSAYIPPKSCSPVAALNKV